MSGACGLNGRSGVVQHRSEGGGDRESGAGTATWTHGARVRGAPGVVCVRYIFFAAARRRVGSLRSPVEYKFMYVFMSF